MLLTNLNNLKLITFDCYGTLIDWEDGLSRSLQQFEGIADEQLPELMKEYVRTEAALEQQSYQPYANIQRLALAKLAEHFRFAIPPGAEDTLPQDIRNWAAFGDTVASLKRLKTRFMLGILSNIDVDLFAATNQRLEVAFDLIITAEDVRSYKPSHAHFIRMLEQSRLKKENILHVAQSLYHDAIPAAALGFQFVWINRYDQTRPPDVPMLAEFSTLSDFADTLMADSGP